MKNLRKYFKNKVWTLKWKFDDLVENFTFQNYNQVSKNPAISFTVVLLQNAFHQDVCLFSQQSTNDHQYQVLVIEAVDMYNQIGLICYSDLNLLQWLSKLAFQMIKNWFKLYNRGTKWFYQQVSHTTQLQGFWTYTTVNLSDKVGDNKTREWFFQIKYCELIMIISYFVYASPKYFGDSNLSTRQVGFVW